MKNNYISIILTIIYLSGCYKKTFHYKTTELPLNSKVPIQLESNTGISYTSEIIIGKDDYTLIYTHDLRLKSYPSDIQMISFDFYENKSSKSKTLSPNKNRNNRVLDSVVKIIGEYWVYYSEANSLKDIAENYRAKLINDSLIDIQPLNIDLPLKLIDWQKYYLLPNNNVALIYRSSKGVFFSESKDGINFNDFVKVGEAGAMPNFISLDNNKYIYSYQIKNSRKREMKSIYSYSLDAGKSWSNPLEITDKIKNSHDAYLFKRLDGRADIYFIYPIGNWRGFSLFRRCIKEDFTLGKEQQVVAKEFGNLAKPSVHRLPTSEIALTFIEQNSGHNLYTTKIYGDAPCD